MLNSKMRSIGVLFLAICTANCSTASPLAGTYYRGDGTGYNVTITLHPAGTYAAKWEGCLGMYGTAEGLWSQEGEWLSLAPTVETDMMKGHLRKLRIIEREDSPVFVPEQDLKSEYYTEYGADDFMGFHREKN
jgi:hypothetical protein